MGKTRRKYRLIIGTGIDLEIIDRIKTLVNKYTRKELGIIFTENEINQCQQYEYPGLYFTLCFSAKEAVGKCMGTGLSGMKWTEIEISVLDDSLNVKLFGEAKIVCELKLIKDFLINWYTFNRHVLVNAIAIG